MKWICLIFLMGLVACGGSKKVIEVVPKDETNLKEKDTEIDTIAKTKEVLSPIEEKIIEPPKIEEIEEVEEEYVAPFLDQPWTNLLQKHVSEDGKVNYKSFKNDRDFLKMYLDDLSDPILLETWDASEQLAYWLNVYNAFTVKLIIDHYPMQSIKEIKTLKEPWDFRFIKIKEKWYTLNDIEHKILRKMGDPRIHFGINCASFSCPPLLNEAFTGKKVDEQLEKLAYNFINDPTRNRITPNAIEISKIFRWFASDFKTSGTLIDFLNKYSKVNINSTAKKSFMKYDWSLNE